VGAIDYFLLTFWAKTVTLDTSAAFFSLYQFSNCWKKNVGRGWRTGKKGTGNKSTGKTGLMGAVSLRLLAVRRVGLVGVSTCRTRSDVGHQS
jgi:hypothetical protein